MTDDVEDPLRERLALGLSVCLRETQNRREGRRGEEKRDARGRCCVDEHACINRDQTRARRGGERAAYLHDENPMHTPGASRNGDGGDCAEDRPRDRTEIWKGDVGGESWAETVSSGARAEGRSRRG